MDVRSRRLVVSEAGEMILSGAEQYWKDPANCLELNSSWTTMGLTPILRAVLAETANIPEKERQSVLELGCGTGRVLSILDCKTYVGIDQSPDMIALCPKDARREFVVASIEDCPIIKADLVLCIEVLHHQTDALETLALIRQRYQYRHLIVTLMVGEKRQEFGLLDGIGSIAVSHAEALDATDGAIVTFVDHDPLSTLIIHYENKSPAKRRKA